MCSLHKHDEMRWRWKTSVMTRFKPSDRLGQSVNGKLLFLGLKKQDNKLQGTSTIPLNKALQGYSKK